MGGTCWSQSEVKPTLERPKTKRWEIITEEPADNKFENREWIPKVIKKEARYALPVGTCSVRLGDDEQICSITGAAFLPNGDLFVVDKNNKKLKVFNSKFQFKNSVQMPLPPENVCSSPRENHAYVTFPDSSKIRQVLVTKDDMVRVDTFNTVAKCTGIACNKYGGVAVAVNVRGNQWQIHLMNKSGELQKRVHGESIFLNPEHMAVTEDMNMVISDRGNSTVFHITPEGYVIFGYKNIRYPLDVFVDKRGYIYVAGPEKIHQLNERGELVQYLLSKIEIGFAPMSLAYRHKDETLIIGGKSDKVRVYILQDRLG